MSSVKVRTKIPTEIPTTAVITTLHNHDQMIHTLCPQLIEFSMECGDAASHATYIVKDRKPIGTTTYKLTLTNLPSGLNSFVAAKLLGGHLNISGKWRVNAGQLVEEVDFDGNFLARKLARANVERAHPGQHMKLIDGMRKVGESGEAGGGEWEEGREVGGEPMVREKRPVVAGGGGAKGEGKGGLEGTAVAL